MVKELVAYLNDSEEMGETAFHQEADEACLRLFDEWLAGFCMYPIDEGIIQFYDVFVKKKNPQLACQALGTFPFIIISIMMKIFFLSFHD